MRRARALDEYLLGDGLDGRTIGADLREYAREPSHIFTPSDDYQAVHVSTASAEENAVGLGEVFRREMGEAAQRLLDGTTVTTENIRASAELRQSIANTVLQRWVTALAIIALVVGVASLGVAILSYQTSDGSGGSAPSVPSPSNIDSGPPVPNPGTWNTGVGLIRQSPS